VELRSGNRWVKLAQFIPNPYPALKWGADPGGVDKHRDGRQSTLLSNMEMMSMWPCLSRV